MNKETKIIGALGAITLAIMIGGALLLGNSSGSNFSSPAPIVVDTKLLMGESSYVKGLKDAKVQIVEFSDFQCPACAAADPIVKKINQDYADRIYFVYRHFPLPQHKNAVTASLASEAAGKQDKFWEMHDLLFEKQDAWAEQNNAKDIFISYAKDLGLNEDQFKSDLDDQSLKDKINADSIDGERLNVNSTPTFYINGSKYTGSLGYEQMKSVIDSQLQ